MSEFPRLKTGVAVQYPVRMTLGYRTRILRFLGGGEQRFRQRGTGKRRWTIQLDRLDEQEAAEVLAFFEAQQGCAGEFAFTDPDTGIRYPSCSFEEDQCYVRYMREGAAAATLVIREN